MISSSPETPTAWRVWWVSMNTSRTELFENETSADQKARDVGGCVIPLYAHPGPAQQQSLPIDVDTINTLTKQVLWQQEKIEELTALAPSGNVGALDPVTVEACAKVADKVASDWQDDSYLAAKRDSYHRANVASNHRSGAKEVAREIRAMIGQPAPVSNAGPVAWTNEAQLGFLKTHPVGVPMAMWAEKSTSSDIALYASPAGCASKAVTSTNPAMVMPEKLSPQVIAACVGGGITSDQITHIYSLILAAVSLTQTDGDVK
jgi:hypothetical protein